MFQLADGETEIGRTVIFLIWQSIKILHLIPFGEWEGIYALFKTLGQKLREVNQSPFLHCVELCERRSLNFPQADWTPFLCTGREDTTNNLSERNNLNQKNAPEISFKKFQNY